MNDFDRMFEAARHNEYSSAYPTVLVVGLIVLGGICVFKNVILRRLCKILVIVIFSALAFRVSELEIEEKWRLRGQLSSLPNLTHTQQMAVTTDGANRVAGPIAGGIVAAAIFVGPLLLIHTVQKSIRKTSK